MICKLSDLPNGARATVAKLVAATHGLGAELSALHLGRMGELGFLPGEPVQVVRRGPGGREPLAVLVGDTLLALRLLEAQCVEVELAAA